MTNNIYSAFHYREECREERETIEALLPEIKETAEKAVFGNIGDIKYTSRTTPPNGCFWCDGQTLAKVDLPKVYDMLKAGDLHYVDINTYNNVVSLNGSCGFFGLDTANEIFRVPLLKDVYIKSGQVADEFGAESLPNIKGEWGSSTVRPSTIDIQTGVFSNPTTRQTTYYNNATANTSTANNWGLSFDASAGNSTYQDGAKVNPDHVKYRACVVLYSSEKELSIVNWTNSLENKTQEGIARIDAKADSYLDKTQITNCITEIPQDIKVELNDGVLTLKAGSKVYVPNGFEADGSLKFDEVVVESDLAMPNGSTTAGQRMCWVTLPNSHGNGVTQYCFSGNTSVMNSTKADAFATFYNTETNKMYRGNGTAWEERRYSLPVCLATNDTTSAYTSINQVFNGFGYIGSTVFALPGVKGLIPNGRNADGSLRNIEFTTQSVLIQTRDIFGTNKPLVMKGNDFSNYAVADYNEELNLNIGGTGTDIGRAIVGTWSTNSSGVITSFTPKLPFHAVDYSDIKDLKRDLKAGAIIPTVVYFYQTTEAWCKLWSDDTLEQGGRCWVADVGSNGSVNFLKPYSHVPMACGSKSEYGSFSESSGCIHNITATNITMGLRWGGDNSRGGRYCSFYAIGKAAK